MAMMGLFSGSAPADPKNGALPLNKPIIAMA